MFKICTYRLHELLLPRLITKADIIHILKRLVLFLMVVGILGSCSSSKTVLNKTQTAPSKQVTQKKYRMASSTLAVEVEDKQEENRIKTKSNTAVVNVVNCDEIAKIEENKSTSSNLKQHKIDPKLKSNIPSNSNTSVAESGGVMLQKEIADLIPNKSIKKFKSINKLRKLQKKARKPGKKNSLDGLVYIILVILLILLIIRLLEVFVGPLFNLLVAILLIFLIGRLLGIW